MELALTIKYLAKQYGIDDVDFMSDVILFDEGDGAFIKEWNLSFDKPSEELLISAEVLALAEEESLKYKDLRAEAYPSIPEQLDMIYWDKVNSTTLWKSKIQEIKDLYPKG